MRKWYYRSLAGLASLLLAGILAGCAEQAAEVKPAEALALLRTGRPLLGCREPCLAEWRRSQPQAAQLDAGGRWQDLAVLVLRIGYQDDLSLYYLGRAAEGVGYRGPAASYYRQSLQLSGTSIACEQLSRQCGGVILPRAASLRVAALERESNQPRPRRTGSAPQGPEAPAAAPGEAEAPAPGDAEAPAAGPAASPVASPGGPAASEYIEPPPAAR